MKYIILNILLLLSSTHAFMSKDMSLRGSRITTLAPVLFNPDSFLFEFGFITDKRIKKINYRYNAYAKVFLSEESDNELRSDRSAALGVKLGLFLPTQPWLPIFLETGFGFAKTALQDDPWFGERDNNKDDKDMFLGEVGLMYLINNKVMLRVTYQENNVDYFKRDVFISIGGNF